jgi:hypothetical protein
MLRLSLALRRSPATAVLLCASILIAGCGAGSESEAAAPAADATSTQRSDDQEPAASEGPEQDTIEDVIPQRLAPAPGVSAEFTSGTWESGPAAWLEASSRCADLLLFEGVETSGPDDREAFFWVYWRSDDALPWEQVTIIETFGEFGWATPSDPSLVAPDLISVPTEWVEVVRYERWPAPGPSADPEEPTMIPADGYAVIARTVAPAGFIGAGSVIIGERSQSDHDPRRLLETLELDLRALIDSCD